MLLYPDVYSFPDKRKNENTHERRGHCDRLLEVCREWNLVRYLFKENMLAGGFYMTSLTTTVTTAETDKTTHVNSANVLICEVLVMERYGRASSGVQVSHMC